MISQYSKSIASIIAAALAVVVTTNTGDGLSTPELINIAIAIVTAVGVYAVPNVAEGFRAYAKGAVAFAGAALVAVASAITDSVVTGSEWATIALAALAAIGVVVVPNVPSAGTLPGEGNILNR